MRRIATLLSALAFAALLHAAPPALAAPCTYTLGFAALHDAIPDIVGDCLQDAQPMDNGDVYQATERGLLVWRKADNWTAFTDGRWTWVNGPYGPAARPNDERFEWEADAVAALGPACDPAQPLPGAPIQVCHEGHVVAAGAPCAPEGAVVPAGGIQALTCTGGRWHGNNPWTVPETVTPPQ